MRRRAAATQEKRQEGPLRGSKGATASTEEGRAEEERTSTPSILTS